MADTRPIQLGVIGTGLALERLHWPVLHALRDRYTVVAFADIAQDAAARFAAYAGLGMDGYCADYRILLERRDVEAVLILLPIPLLLPVTREALAAGKHVLCEKPTGVDEAQGRAFLALAHQYPALTVLIGEHVFYRDDVRLARSLLDAGAIGQPHLMTYRIVQTYVPRAGEFSGTPWRRHAAYRGGPHLDGGVHHIAQIRVLCGDALSVHGVTRRANSTIDAPSDLVVNLVFDQDLVGSYLAAYPEIATPPEPHEMRLYGTEGTLSLDRDDAGRRLRLYRADGSCETYTLADPFNGFYGEWLNFSDAIRHGEPVIATIEQSFKNMQVVLRALDSAEQDVALPVHDTPSGATAAVPLWRPRGATGLFDGLPGGEIVVHRVEA
jgi:predicted dehydrogenase